MTETSVRDSAAVSLNYFERNQLTFHIQMKQIAYLTMVFLPATFMATVFGMNVQEINPGSLGKLSVYIGTAVAMTACTAWVILAFQSKHKFPPRTPLWRRLAWPYVLLKQRWTPRLIHEQLVEHDVQNLDISDEGHKYEEALNWNVITEL